MQDTKEKEASVERFWREWLQAIFFDGLTVQEAADAFNVDSGEIEEVVYQFRRHCVDTFIAYPFSVVAVRKELRARDGKDERAEYIADVLTRSYAPGEALPTVPAVARVFDVMGSDARAAFLKLDADGYASEELPPNSMRTRWYRTDKKASKKDDDGETTTADASNVASTEEDKEDAEDARAAFPYEQIAASMRLFVDSDKKARVLADALREYATPGKWLDLSTIVKRLHCPFYYATIAVNILVQEGVVERRPPCVYYYPEKGASNV